MAAPFDDDACPDDPACQSGSAYLLEVRPPQLMAGDANQDLSFDQQDIVQVAQAARYLTGQPATWGEGDWDGAPGGEPGRPPEGNGRFDQLDIVAALATGTYLAGPYAALNALALPLLPAAGSSPTGAQLGEADMIRVAAPEPDMVYVPVPEPGGMLLLALGGCAVAGCAVAGSQGVGGRGSVLHAQHPAPSTQYSVLSTQYSLPAACSLPRAKMTDHLPVDIGQTSFQSLAQRLRGDVVLDIGQESHQFVACLRGAV